jgi:hypothetical protein
MATRKPKHEFLEVRDVEDCTLVERHVARMAVGLS